MSASNPQFPQCSAQLKVIPGVPQYAGIILVTPENGVILQLRDNNPAIADPNCLSIFAGRSRVGETPLQTALREIEEETLRHFSEAELTFLVSYTTDEARYDAVRQSHCFVAHDVDPNSLDIQEGQGYRIIHNAADLERRPFALISKEILQYYFATRSSQAAQG